MIDLTKKYKVRSGEVLCLAKNPNDYDTLIGLVYLTERFPFNNAGDIVVGSWTLEGKSIPNILGHDIQETPSYGNIPVDSKVLATILVDYSKACRFTAHFSHYDDGKLWVFSDGRTSHTSNGLLEVQQVELV